MAIHFILHCYIDNGFDDRITVKGRSVGIHRPGQGLQRGSGILDDLRAAGLRIGDCRQRIVEHRQVSARQLPFQDGDLFVVFNAVAQPLKTDRATGAGLDLKTVAPLPRYVAYIGQWILNPAAIGPSQESIEIIGGGIPTVPRLFCRR